jgi:pimeloyl-ACP methyl ester carboxylesterase
MVDPRSAEQRSREALWRAPSSVRRGYADYRYGQLHYRIARPAADTGRRPLFLFHQTGSSGRCYEGLIAELGRGRVAIVADTPAFGASDPVPQPPTIADFAAAMGELIDHFGFAAIDVMGDHTGSKTAVEVAIRRPQQVRRVVLNAAPVYSDAELAYLLSLDQSIETANEDGAHVAARWKWSRENTPVDVPLTVRELEFVESLRAGPFAYHCHHAAFGYLHADNLPKVTQPLLLLHAHDDLWAPTARAAAYIRNGRMIDLPQWGRDMLLYRYREVAPIIAAFLDEDQTAR